MRVGQEITDDLISRQQALAELEIVRKEMVKQKMYGAEHVIIRYGIRIIEELPTAEKHGRWVLITNKHIDPQEYMCSVCGRIIKHYGIPELLLERYPYCNCGAKMERNEE